MTINRTLTIINLSTSQNDLVDFSFTFTQIWTMSRGKDCECQVYYTKITTNTEPGVPWMPAILDPMLNQQEVPYNCDYVDPREAYLNYIFYPGRFPLNVINKALNVSNYEHLQRVLNLDNCRYTRDHLYIVI